MKKKIIIAAASFLLFVSAQTFAANTNASNFVTQKIQEGLKQEFGQIQNVSWSKRSDNQVVALFQLNNQTVEAYFNREGDYSFCTTAISKENLPLKVSLTLNRNFADKNIRAVLQVCNEEGTSYYIMASDTANGKTKIWKAYTDGQVELFKKI